MRTPEKLSEVEPGSVFIVVHVGNFSTSMFAEWWPSSLNTPLCTDDGRLTGCGSRPSLQAVRKAVPEAGSVAAPAPAWRRPYALRAVSLHCVACRQVSAGTRTEVARDQGSFPRVCEVQAPGTGEVDEFLIPVSHSGPAGCVTLCAFSPLVARFEIIRSELSSVLSAGETSRAHSEEVRM